MYETRNGGYLRDMRTSVRLPKQDVVPRAEHVVDEVAQAELDASPHLKDQLARSVASGVVYRSERRPRRSEA